ncbi:cytochrome c oxidase assembly protein [Novosphingobium ginsenosidimutans]|uniref:Cytochrome c oxidase assembly protein CtaG n=1 Tax=Novosphingobium ginsenosidimutans TaxID=1176536 RepID=A0A5B8S0J0_9SPHN|nr:cytochrome c oxidase assembly protein [Novosphingobium ginsenosidimutans]QEA15086.1 cytochrome c oxidase assembly protein [Novosphingobium ginsenosidimutans]
MAVLSLPKDPNARTGVLALLGAAAMLGLGFASVPLYRIFCQVTGFGGTTMRSTEAEASAVKITNKLISVRFDANVDRLLPWHFIMDQTTQELRIGSRKMAYYSAKNLSDQPITGIASFNVEPELAGKYFHKVQCFCFNEQTLQPGQSVNMPVIYYVDPKILDDPETKDIEQITLSYTFHKAADQPAKTLDQQLAAR